MREDFFGFGPPWQVSPKEQPLRPGAASPGMFHCRDWRLCGMSEINRVYFCNRSRTAIQHEKKKRALPELRAHRLHERTSDNRPIMTNWMVFWNPASQCAVTLIFVWYQQITRSLWLPVARMHMANQGKSHMFIHFASFCTYPGVAVGCQETRYLCSRCPTQMHPKCHEKVGRTPLVSSMDSSVRPFLIDRSWFGGL